MIGMSHEIPNYVALKSVIIMIGILLGEKRSNEEADDFYGTHDPYEFCDWTAHMNCYFDLFELSDAYRV